jgi:hypothetical protein
MPRYWRLQRQSGMLESLTSRLPRLQPTLKHGSVIAVTTAKLKLTQANMQATYVSYDKGEHLAAAPEEQDAVSLSLAIRSNRQRDP